jgi:hypothetical protein
MSIVIEYHPPSKIKWILKILLWCSIIGLLVYLVDWMMNNHAIHYHIDTDPYGCLIAGFSMLLLIWYIWYHIRKIRDFIRNEKFSRWLSKNESPPDFYPIYFYEPKKKK